ncbi:MAG: serine protease, partial [Planctomycetota bacterium]
RVISLRLAATALFALASTAFAAEEASLSSVEAWRPALAKVVKLYGTGGLAGLEAYQTGLLVNASGVILTPNTSVLEQGEVTVVLHDGRRFSGVVAGADPISELAVITIDAGDAALPCFEVDAATAATAGQSVLALANVFGIAAGEEPVTVMHGVIAAIAPRQAERRPFDPPAEPTVLLLDAVTSNPGAAGGAVVDRRGRLLGMLGPERRSRVTGAWLSYATPAAELAAPIERVLQGGRSVLMGSGPAAARIDLLKAFGFALTPDIVARTPPFVDYVETGSKAAEAGLVADDLVVTVAGVVTGSAAEVRRVLASRTGEGPVDVLVQRGERLIDLKIESTLPAQPAAGGERSRRAGRR